MSPMFRFRTIGVLFGCFARKIDGPGLPGGVIIYQGHLFPLKGHLGSGSYQSGRRQEVDAIRVTQGPCTCMSRNSIPRRGIHEVFLSLESSEVNITRFHVARWLR